jgi:hypothetical protein
MASQHEACYRKRLMCIIVELILVSSVFFCNENFLLVLVNRFSIDRHTDPERQFAIDGNGLVTTAKPLDRETSSGHRVHILAIDKGLLNTYSVDVTGLFAYYWLWIPSRSASLRHHLKYITVLIMPELSLP